MNIQNKYQCINKANDKWKGHTTRIVEMLMAVMVVNGGGGCFGILCCVLCFELCLFSIGCGLHWLETKNKNSKRWQLTFTFQKKKRRRKKKNTQAGDESSNILPKILACEEKATITFLLQNWAHQRAALLIHSLPMKSRKRLVHEILLDFWNTCLHCSWFHRS